MTPIASSGFSPLPLQPKERVVQSRIDSPTFSPQKLTKKQKYDALGRNRTNVSVGGIPPSVGGDQLTDLPVATDDEGYTDSVLTTALPGLFL
jgi:hypothetical protein